MLRAANGSAATGSVLSQAVVDANAGDSEGTIVAGQARQFFDWYQPNSALVSAPTFSRRVLLADSGSADVSPAVTVAPELKTYSPIVRDADGNLAAIVSGTSAPFRQSPLGGGASLTLLTPSAPTYASVDLTTYADFKSVAPRALSVVFGKRNASDARSVYVEQLPLDTGEALPSRNVSTEAVSGQSNPCTASPIVRSDGAGEFAVGWWQLNANMTGCDLYVDGIRLSTGLAGVAALTGVAGGVLTAVWEDIDAATSTRRLLWEPS